MPATAVAAAVSSGGRRVDIDDEEFDTDYPLVQDETEFINPDAQVGRDAARLLGRFADLSRSRSRHSVRTRANGETEPLLPPTVSGSSDGGEDEAAAHRRSWKQLPWYKRPSPWWIISLTPVIAIAMATTIAPRIQLYTQLACQSHKPEYSAQTPLYNISADTGMGPADIEFVPSLWDLPFPKISEPSPKCNADPEVQAAVAKLIATLGTSMGVLSCLTTGFWGQMSDRHGRRLVMGIAVFGTLINDFNFILVSHYHRVLPGGYRFLIAGPLFDGLLGGITTAMAANHAYLADCIDPHSRSRMFSLSSGLFFTGLGIGPTIGGLIISKTKDLLSVFYLATCVHFLFAMVVWFLVPESLSKKAMLEARLKRKVNEGEVGSVRWWMKPFGFLAPLAIFMPKSVEVPVSGNVQGEEPATKKVRDWNLTLVAICTGVMMLLMASYQFKFQYASAQFGWGSEQLGYWLSLIGAVRAVHLMVLLPLVIRFFKPKPGTTSTRRKTFFDLTLARVSLAIEVVGYIALIFARNPIVWTSITLAMSLGGGFNPAMQSVALEVYKRRGENVNETGKLFGALSVVGALCSQIIGPTLFGTIYLWTVRDYPQAIFVISAAAIVLSFMCTLLIRIYNVQPAEQSPPPYNANENAL